MLSCCGFYDSRLRTVFALNVPALLPLIAMLFPETQVLGEKVSQLKMLLIYGAAG